MHTTQQPKTFMEVINEIANRPLGAKVRGRFAPSVRWHGDKRRGARSKDKADLRKQED